MAHPGKRSPADAGHRTVHRLASNPPRSPPSGTPVHSLTTNVSSTRLLIISGRPFNPLRTSQLGNTTRTAIQSRFAVDSREAPSSLDTDSLILPRKPFRRPANRPSATERNARTNLGTPATGTPIPVPQRFPLPAYPPARNPPTRQPAARRPPPGTGERLPTSHPPSRTPAHGSRAANARPHPPVTSTTVRSPPASGSPQGHPPANRQPVREPGKASRHDIRPPIDSEPTHPAPSSTDPTRGADHFRQNISPSHGPPS